jgi:diguanylate cyclase (GGDEF)-like protein
LRQAGVGADKEPEARERRSRRGTHLDAAGELLAFALELTTSSNRGPAAALLARRLTATLEGTFSAVYLTGAAGTLTLEGVAGRFDKGTLEQPPAIVEPALSGEQVVLASWPELAAAFPWLGRGTFAAATPIAFGDTLFGALVVAAPDGPSRRAQLRFVSAVADLAAASFANAADLAASATEARRDALTGLRNQRAFHEHLEASLQAASGAGSEVALVLFDLDDFKQINDREGHLVGDQVLRDVARLTLGVLRSGEEAFRTGGEEFAVVIEGGREAGKRVAERVRRAFARKRRGHGLPSISAGVAAFPPDAEGKEALVHRADLALYAAKERGKNRTIAFHERLQADTRSEQAEAHRRREVEWWQKVLGLTGMTGGVADELGPGYRPQEVAVLAEQVASRLGLSRREKRAVVIAAILTELSKLRIPESIRRKRGPLNERDWQLVRESAELTAATLQPLGSLRDVVEVVHACRERWDGSGFPDGLSGAEIPIGARVVAVAEAFCAMTSGRSYRPARTRTRAIHELEEHAGTHFDPACVEAILHVLDTATEPLLRVAAATG